MYKIPDVLTHIDQNLYWVLFFSACGWIGGTIQFFEGLRLTWRDKVVGLPLGYIAIVFAHDSTFFFHYDFWFSINHWYYKYTVYLFAMWPFVELAAIIWLVRVARKEVAPDLPPIAFYGIYALYQITAIVLYRLLMSWIDDPLFLAGWSIAQIINIVFLIPMALRRKSTKGQSRIMAWAVFLSPATTTMLLTPSIAPVFLSSLYIAGTLCTTALGLAYIGLYEYYRHQETKAALTSSGRLSLQS